LEALWKYSFAFQFACLSMKKPKRTINMRLNMEKIKSNWYTGISKHLSIITLNINGLNSLIKKLWIARPWWLTPVILVTQEAAIFWWIVVFNHFQCRCLNAINFFSGTALTASIFLLFEVANNHDSVQNVFYLLFGFFFFLDRLYILFFPTYKRHFTLYFYHSLHKKPSNVINKLSNRINYINRELML
jgi:hypothetical protein